MDAINHMVGVPIPAETQIELLQRMQLKATLDTSKNVLNVMVPPTRHDILQVRFGAVTLFTASQKLRYLGKRAQGLSRFYTSRHPSGTVLCIPSKLEKSSDISTDRLMSQSLLQGTSYLKTELSFRSWLDSAWM